MRSRCAGGLGARNQVAAVLLAFAATAALTFVPAPARADDEATEQARQHYLKGTKYFELGQWDRCYRGVPRSLQAAQRSSLSLQPGTGISTQGRSATRPGPVQELPDSESRDSQAQRHRKAHPDAGKGDEASAADNPSRKAERASTNATCDPGWGTSPHFGTGPGHGTGTGSGSGSGPGSGTGSGFGPGTGSGTGSGFGSGSGFGVHPARPSRLRCRGHSAHPRP